MAEYIEREDLIERLELRIKSWSADRNSNADKMVLAYKEILYIVKNISTADVVPNGEVDKLKEANAELSLALLYECKPTKKLLAELEKAARDKVAREIFEEIEKTTFSFGYGVRADRTVAHTRTIDDDLLPNSKRNTRRQKMRNHKLYEKDLEREIILSTFDRAIRNAKEHGKVFLDFVDVSVLEKLVNICKSQKAEIEALKLINSTYECDTSHIRAVAIQEFSERLKGKMGDVARIVSGDTYYYLVGKDLIDENANELTEENK